MARFSWRIEDSRRGQPPVEHSGVENSRAENSREQNSRTELATAGLLSAVLKRCAGVVLALLVGLAAPAQAADDSLYQALGGDDGVAKISAGLVDRVYADERIKHLFQQTNPRFLTEQLRKQFCELAGGPCKYDGETMKKSHAGLAINKAHFNALVEDLQLAMDAQGVPFAAQNRLLALLAPMHRDVITR